MATLVLLNNFMHDFSAAGWIFCSLLLLAVLRSVPGTFRERRGDELHGVIEKILKSIRKYMLYSFGGIVIFGIIRAVAYRQYEWSEAAGQGQVTVLIVKHILLTVVFAGGLYYYVKAGKLIKNND